jgi:hypothetical protein
MMYPVSVSFHLNQKGCMKSVLLLIGLKLLFVATTECRAEDFATSRIGMTQKDSVEVDSVDVPTVPSKTPSAGQELKTPPAKAPAEPVRKKDRVPPNLGKQSTSPPLDLPSLEKRLRETKAIGMFTKITLKNQVDDLVNQFREYHGGRGKATLNELRQRYDMLVLKLLSLLQDSDATLAHTIVASREAIWSILTDPAKLSSI